MSVEQPNELYRKGFDAYLNGQNFSRAVWQAMPTEFFEIARGFNAAEQLDQETKPTEAFAR